MSEGEIITTVTNLQQTKNLIIFQHFYIDLKMGEVSLMVRKQEKKMTEGFRKTNKNY